MPLEAPKLDDRTFEELLREAQLRIPRYCPQWTDFNDSDPGMALVQLFAWFTELMCVQMNQVPQRNYIKFLKLLNIELRPARPARTHVCFTPSPLAVKTPIPPRSRFEVPGASGSDVVSFETVKGFDLVPYPLDAVQVRDGVQFQDYSAANDLGNETFRPLGWNPQVGNALYLGFKPHERPTPSRGAAPPPDFPERILLRVFLPISNETPRGVSRGAELPKPEQVIVFEYRSKLDLTGNQSADTTDRWRPLTVLSDETRAFTREGTIELAGPDTTILETSAGKPTTDNQPRYWIRARLAEGGYSRDTVPSVAMIRVNAVEVENLATFREEALGETDGFRRDFKLKHAPVDPSTLKLALEGVGEDDLEWTRRDDFFASGKDDKHYTLNATSGEIQFGNGRYGRVPPPGGVLVARQYLAGGGSNGNVRADAINTPPAGVRGDLLDRVSNPRAAAGGTDEESLEELKVRAPLALRGDNRAVTADDYVRIAKLVAGVAKANTIELRHPDYPTVPIPGTVTVVIVPDDTKPKAQPSQDLLDRTARELQRVRPVGTEVFVVGPKYRIIEIEATVIAESGVSETQVKESVRKAIEEYLAPVRRPEKPGAASKVPSLAARMFPLGWTFEHDFYVGRLYEVIFALTLEGGSARLVKSVTRIQAFEGGVPAGERVRFAPDELPCCTAQVEITPDLQEGR